VVHFSFLGTCAAVPTENRDNVSILFDFGNLTFLVDVGGSPVKKLMCLGCDWMDLSGLVLTHHHPDHIYGIHSLVHCLCINPNGNPLKIFSYPKAGEIARSLLEIQFSRPLPELPVSFEYIPADEITTFFDDKALKITAIPADHGIEALSLVFEYDKMIIVYSSDTRPNLRILDYVNNADIVIHESTFLEEEKQEAKIHGHSTAKEAADFANAMNARILFLCHFKLHSGTPVHEFEKEAAENFRGNIIIPKELHKYNFLTQNCEQLK